jgi:hypothetical protein
MDPLDVFRLAVGGLAWFLALALLRIAWIRRYDHVRLLGTAAHAFLLLLVGSEVLARVKGNHPPTLVTCGTVFAVLLSGAFAHGTLKVDWRPPHERRPR